MNSQQNTRLEIGQDITLVSKGIRHGYGNPWIDIEIRGQTYYATITKIGNKYLTVKTFHFKEDGSREYAYYESKENTEENFIHNGIRTDLKTQHQNFIQNLHKHHEQYETAQRNIDHATYKITSRLLKHWNDKHPRPTNPLGETQNDNPM